MSIDDLKVTRPSTIPERISRVANKKEYDLRWDFIFRKQANTTQKKNTLKEKKNNGSSK